MFSVVFSQEYTTVPGFLIRMRRAAGMTQRELAARIGRSQSHVHKMETGQRRIELVEFFRFALATGHEPAGAIDNLIVELQASGCAYRLSAPSSEASEVAA